MTIDTKKEIENLFRKLIVGKTFLPPNSARRFTQKIVDVAIDDRASEIVGETCFKITFENEDSCYHKLLTPIELEDRDD